MTGRRNHRAIVAVVVLPLLLAGCASSPPEAVDAESHETTILDYDATVAEYTQTAESLALPEGQVYPDVPFARTDELYQQGFGRNQAVYFWNCAWGRQWLKLRGVDADLAAQAFETYASVRATDTYQQSWDPVSMQAPFEEALESAELGDASQIQADITANCPA
ncbi:hypothetical protein [Microbacterium sp. NPDC058389]|uniref:hypothetical protein n=1 Tax=Microbacterium sp. NPDC058389 TaxID=3346475 RepID=UPI00365234CE